MTLIIFRIQISGKKNFPFLHIVFIILRFLYNNVYIFLNIRTNEIEQLHTLKSDLAFEIIQRFITEEELNFTELLNEFNEFIYIFE